MHYVFLFVLMVPNLMLVVTEHQTALVVASNILLPLALYSLLASVSRNLGRTVWLMFPLVFLAAFQIVLTRLFGQSVIGVDMFLNLVTTNPSEAGEMLAGLLPAVALVVVLYVPMLVAATIAIRRKARLSRPFIRKQQIRGAACLSAGMLAALATLVTARPIGVTTDIFPVNVTCNLALAVGRSWRVAHYAETSQGFVFHAISAAKDSSSMRRICVIVIGETARAENFGILGYGRDTTPRLRRLTGLTAFTSALSESNTTHKSVPMLLAAATAATFDSLYCQRSIITAFHEAGYKTAFFSNQQRNRSFIDFFGEEADTCLFVKDQAPGENVYDARLVSYARQEIARQRGDVLIVLHCYGSHYNYSERYPREFARFTPDDVSEPSAECRRNLLNAYDNTILYTDYLLASLADVLRQTHAEATLLYTSDHGEDIYDDGFHFLHASPVPTIMQLHVPLLVWGSDEYRAGHAPLIAALAANSHKAVSTSASLFHTALHLAGIQTPYLDLRLSLASPTYKPSSRRYITDRNEAVALSSMLDTH